MNLRRLAALAAAASLAAPACTGFPRGWHAARTAHPADPATGAWRGTWLSATNGHHGGLRAVVSTIPNQPGMLRFRYRASWKHILCAGFSVDCLASPQPDGSISLSGSKDLGTLFGGTFSHSATIHNNSLKATYHASMDHGTMVLQRLNH